MLFNLTLVNILCGARINGIVCDSDNSANVYNMRLDYHTISQLQMRNKNAPIKTIQAEWLKYLEWP